jgi:hypothetical protein
MMLPRLEIPQFWVPGTSGPGVIFTLHRVDTRSFSQRISITCQAPVPPAHRHPGRLDFVATRDQLYDLVGELDERAALIADIPAEARNDLVG